MAKAERIEWIDALRGLAMWLVVLMHVQFFGGCEGTIYNALISWMFMPLFFFVSGLVIYKQDRQWFAHAALSYLWQKVLQILVPTAIMMLLACWVLDYNLLVVLRHPMKYGYWFTITLFGFIALYVFWEWLMRVRKAGEKCRLVSLLLLTGLCSLLLSRHGLYTRLFGEKVMVWYDALQIGEWSYFQFFVLGVLVRKYKDWCVRWSGNRYVAGGVIAAYILMAIVYVRGVPLEGVSNYLRAVSNRLLPYASIYIVTILFYLLRSFWASSRTGRALQIVGRNTLGIYLIHYFFLAGNWSFLRIISANTPPPFCC